MSILDLLSSLLLLTFLLRCHHCRETDGPGDATGDFSVRLYHQLQAGGGQDNIVFSPLSVAVALGMVGLGARAASLEQIQQVAGFPHLPSGEAHTSVPGQSELQTSTAAPLFSRWGVLAAPEPDGAAG